MKKSNLLFAAVFFLAVAWLPVFGQGINWHAIVHNTPASSFGNTVPGATLIDSFGNTYVGYNGSGPITVGNQNYGGSDSTQQMTVVKYSPAGSPVMVKRFGPTGPNSGAQIVDMELDSAGNLLVAGDFSGQISIEGVIVETPAPNDRDYFVARWSSSGTFAQVMTGNGPGARYLKDLTVRPSGEILLAGFALGNANFGQLTFQATNTRAFLARLTVSGTVLSVTGPANSATQSSTATSVGTDAAGNIYVAGYFNNTFVWGNQSFTAPVGPNQAATFWVKLNPAGQPVNGFSLPTTNSASYITLATDALGYSYLAGRFPAGTLNLGGISLTNAAGTDAYLAKFDPNGVLQWAKHLDAQTAQGNAIVNELALDGTGKVFLAGFTWGELLLDTLVLPATTNFDFFAAGYNAFTGDLQWGIRGQSPGLDENAQISASPSGQVALVGGYRDQFTMGGITTGPQAPDNQQSAFLMNLVHDYNAVTGSVFLDANLNGTQEPTEGGYPNGLLVTLSPNQQGYTTSASGAYQAIAGQGTYTVEVPNAPAYHNVVPTGPTQVSFSGFGNVAPGYNLALQPIPNQLDLRVLVTPLVPARPGFPTAYRITYSNPGTVAIPGGTVTLSLDPQFTYLSSVPSGSMSGNTLTWNYANLLPGQTRNINVNLSLPTSAVVGNPVTVTAAVFPVLDDLTPADNSETNTRLITASYDPNIIEVNHEELALQQVQNGQWLEYTIHFQNQGTDTAFTVMIRDSLQANLYRMGTIELRGASHSCSWSVNSSGVMTILFTNIRLPHQAANVLGSHGFIRFRIKPKNTLNVGAIIPNRARIYFDYNPAIITNIAETEVVQFSSSAELLNPEMLQLFPNPATDAVTVKALSGRFAAVNLRLLNVLGQEVYSRKVVGTEAGFEQEVSLRNLPSGVYTVQLQTEQGSVVKRLVKQ